MLKSRNWNEELIFVYTLVGNAKLNGLDPEPSLRLVLTPHR